MPTDAPAPFFHVRKDGHVAAVRGAPACELGHVLPSAPQAHADGVFGSWKWDGEALRVTNDRYGFYPLFYYSRANEFAISPSLVTLLDEGAPCDVDVEAVAVFLHLGFFIGDDTPFRHIKVVPPNSSFVWKNGIEVQERRDVGTSLQISRAEAVEEFSRLFRRAVSKRLPRNGEFALALSGGRDSRHILLELYAAGCRPAYSITASRYGPGDNDVEIAALLAQAVGSPHVVVPQIPCIEAELRKNVATSFCADEHAWFVPVGDYLAGTVDTIYDGIAGDVLSASLFQDAARLELARAGRFAELADVVIGRSTDRLQRTLDPAFRAADSTRTARERVTRELQRYATAANPVTMFYFWNRTRREIALAPFGLFSRVATCFCPYVDHDLFDFLASLPPDITLDKTFHTDTISRTYPAFAHIPYSQKHHGGELRGTAELGGRVLWRGIRTRPERIGRLSRLAAQACRSVVSPSYRERNRVLNPVRLLYMCQLEDVRRDAVSRHGRPRRPMTAA